MTDPEIGKLWVPESAAVLLNDLLTDIKLSCFQDGIDLAITPGTDTYIKCRADANAAMLLYSQLPTLSTEITPLFADDEGVERWRIALGLPIVEPTISTGAVRVKTTGSADFTDGTKGVLPNGKRIAVYGNFPGSVTGDEIAVVSLDTGFDVNAPGGTNVRWATAPTNSEDDATVSYELPLEGGTPGETPERKKQRVLNRMANAADASGNWGGLIQIALNSLGSVQMCFVFPALGGPGSTKIVPVKGFDRKNFGFSRSMSSAATDIVEAAIQELSNDAAQYVVQAAADEELDVALQTTIPPSKLSGGNGNGWIDIVPWPVLDGDTRVTVTAVASATPSVTLNALTTTAPVDGQTHIEWWSPATCSFVRGLIVSHTGGTGAWVCTLEAPLVDALGNEPAVGDYVSPGMENAEGYAESWVDLMEGLGTGENITASGIAPRDSRRPFLADGPRSGMSTSELRQLEGRHIEMTDTTYSYRSATAPTVPASINTAPNIFVPNHFGIYETV
jgi:uncharacterized phage protein gp47/JayE